MELHQLRYFCAVARVGNFTRAAVAQHVAQPSLSQQILKLESELGARLFDRFPRSARLTQFGRAFLPRAEAILRQVGEARTEIQEMAGSEKGSVAIGAIPTIAPYFLPAALTSFSRQHPSVAVSVVEEITPVLLEHLRNGGIDIALLALPVPGEDLLCQGIFSERLYAALPNSHSLASRREIELKEMRNEPFLLLKEGHCFRANAIAACKRSRVKPRVVFESGQFSTILAMVAAGMGVSIVPAMAVEKRNDCRFVLIREQQATRNVGLVELKHRCSTRAQQALVLHLKKANGISSAEL